MTPQTLSTLRLDILPAHSGMTGPKDKTKVAIKY